MVWKLLFFSEIWISFNSIIVKAEGEFINFFKNIFVNSCPPWMHLTLPKTLRPESKKSPAKSKILWFTNSFSFLKIFVKTSFWSTTIALSRDPPLANPIFLIFSISSYKQNVPTHKYFLNLLSEN